MINITFGHHTWPIAGGSMDNINYTLYQCLSLLKGGNHLGSTEIINGKLSLGALINLLNKPLKLSGSHMTFRQK